MPQTQQLLPLLYVVCYAVAAAYVCVAFYNYIATAVARRSIFHTRVRMVPALAALFVIPRHALRQFDVPESLALGLNAVSTLALIVIVVWSFVMITSYFSQLFRLHPPKP
jgi:hypothetical protein